MTPDICNSVFPHARHVRQNYGRQDYVRRFYGNCQTLHIHADISTSFKNRQLHG